ncbi:MAG TPA: ORF6N domain-containing protein [Burkholderiales bacterium]
MPIKGTDQRITSETIATRILVLRNQRVLLDADLAALYGVSTKRLNEQVRRNAGRFPPDFMFPVLKQHLVHLRSQNATSSQDSAHGGRRTLPLAFTEHGALMAANVLRTKRAIEVSIYVVRAFVELRETLGAHRELAKRLDALESRLEQKFSSHDQTIAGILAAIRQLMTPPVQARRPIGFVSTDDPREGRHAK